MSRQMRPTCLVMLRLSLEVLQRHQLLPLSLSRSPPHPTSQPDQQLISSAEALPHPHPCPQ
jgi:hypothetical protein